MMDPQSGTLATPGTTVNISMGDGDAFAAYVNASAAAGGVSNLSNIVQINSSNSSILSGPSAAMTNLLNEYSTIAQAQIGLFQAISTYMSGTGSTIATANTNSLSAQ
jgi:hypothetical protein